MRFKPRYKSCFWAKVDIWGGLLRKRNSFLRSKWDRMLGTLYSRKRRRYQRLCKNYRLIKPSSRANQPYKFPRWAFRNSLANRLCLRRFYGDLGYKQFKRLCRVTPRDTLIQTLESRLDINLYRLGFFSSIFESRQMITHGKVFVNGNKVNFDHYLLQLGDLIEFDKASHAVLRLNLVTRRRNAKVVDRLALSPTPRWIQTDYPSLSFIVVDKIHLAFFFPFRVEFDEVQSSLKYRH